MERNAQIWREVILSSSSRGLTIPVSAFVIVDPGIYMDTWREPPSSAGDSFLHDATGSIEINAARIAICLSILFILIIQHY